MKRVVNVVEKSLPANCVLSKGETYPIWFKLQQNQIYSEKKFTLNIHTTL